MAEKESATEDEFKSLTKPEEINRRKRSGLRERTVKVLRRNFRVLATIASLVVGLCLGFALKKAHLNEDALMFLGLPGELFLRCLKCLIAPLVVTMVITSTSTMEPKTNGKIATVATFGFLLTHVIAAIIAVALFYAFRPDTRAVIVSEKDTDYTVQTQDVFMDLLRNIFPNNFVAAMISQTTTTYRRVEERQTVVNSSSNETETTVTSLQRSVGKTRGVNIIGLITICLAVGISSSKILSRNGEFLRFMRQAREVVLVIAGWIFWTTPVGVASLVAQSVASVKELDTVLYDMGVFVASVLVGLAIHLLVALPVILLLLTRKNPLTFTIRCVRPLLIAVASSTTSAAMPEMLKSSDRCGINSKISSLVIPMSVSLHADGSALYTTMGAFFLAQSSGRGIDAGDLFVVGTLSSVLALAVPPVPGSSIMTLVIVLSSLNVPLEGVAMLFVVDWILERCCNGVNAVSHIMVAACTQAICGRRTVARSCNDDFATRMESVSAAEDGDSVHGTFAFELADVH